jgi:hypothetical protein
MKRHRLKSTAWVQPNPEGVLMDQEAVRFNEWLRNDAVPTQRRGAKTKAGKHTPLLPSHPAHAFAREGMLSSRIVLHHAPASFSSRSHGRLWERALAHQAREGDAQSHPLTLVFSAQNQRPITGRRRVYAVAYTFLFQYVDTQ